MTTENLSPRWKTWQKIIFRVLFLFLLYFTIDYLFFTFAIALPINFKSGVDLVEHLSILHKPLYWLDAHLYHIGYNPKKNVVGGPDAAFGIVLYISIFITCLLAGAIWSWLDRKRPSYNKLNYWFRVYLRYAVAIVMLGYGMDKLIPVQMAYPNAYTLLGRFGDQSLFNVLWNFLGASPGYEIFTGICEITGSLLLLFRRSSVFGCLLMCTILTNVVALNIFYNVSVKTFSFLLLVCILFLLAPFFQRLVQLFFYEQKVSLAEKHYHFQSRTTRRLLNLSGALLIALLILGNLSGNFTRYRKNIAGRGQIYEVTSFVTKDTLQANIADTLNWKRFVLMGGRSDTTNYAIIYYNNINNEYEHGDWYYYIKDTIKKTFTIREISGPIIHHYSFTYNPEAKDSLTFTGKFKGYDVKINMKPVMDSMYLNKEKIKWVQDY